MMAADRLSANKEAGLAAAAAHSGICTPPDAGRGGRAAC